MFSVFLIWIGTCLFSISKALLIGFSCWRRRGLSLRFVVRVSGEVWKLGVGIFGFSGCFLRLFCVSLFLGRFYVFSLYGFYSFGC